MPIKRADGSIVPDALWKGGSSTTRSDGTVFYPVPVPVEGPPGPEGPVGPAGPAGSSAFNKSESVLVAFNGQTNFILSTTPLAGSDVQMFVNGMLYEKGVDYSILGPNVTWLNTMVLQAGLTGDSVVFVYQV